MKRLAYLLPLALVLVFGIWFALGLVRDKETLPSALLDRPVPAFDLAALPTRPAARADDGLSASDLDGGEVSLVNVFASWCAPCAAEHPVLTRAARELGVPIHAINYKDKAQAAADWLQRHGDIFSRIGADRDGRAGIEWGVYGVPETYVIDRQGVIRYRHVGALTWDDVQNTLRPLIERLRAS